MNRRLPLALAVWGALAGCLALPACTANVELAIDLRTDLVAGTDFDAVRLRVDGADELPVPVDADDVTPSLRVYEGRVAPGRHELRVALFSRGDEVVARMLSVVVERDTILAAVLNSNCRGVVCPGSGDPSDATECLDRRCVSPECLLSGGDGCDSCMVSAECTGIAECARQCVSGVCRAVPDDGACAPTSYCDPDRGCVPRTASDAGVPPDARDAGRPDAGVSCAPLTTCGGSCVDLNDETSCGTTCANAVDCTALAGVSAATCAAGSCAIDDCEAGQGDCDGNPANGCEGELRENWSCGSCGEQINCIDRPNTFGGYCSTSGSCLLNCNAGYRDCNFSDEDGCETALWVDTSCGNVCSSRVNCTNRPNTTGGSCVSGTCNITCAPLWGNCNGNVADGCECATG